jgi:hypothetical protein
LPRAVARSPRRSSDEVASWYDASLIASIARAASAASGKAITLPRKRERKLIVRPCP